MGVRLRIPGSIARADRRNAESDDIWTEPQDKQRKSHPRYIGRAVVALATDAGCQRWNQRSIATGELAKEYGFTDIDGSQPDIWKYTLAVESGPEPNLDDYR